MGAVGREVIRRGPDVAPGHAERGPEVLLDVHPPRVAAELLDDACEVQIARIGIAVARPRQKPELLVRHHGDELVPGRGLERLPMLAARPGPRRILKARCVREQHAQGDAVGGRLAGTVHLPQLRHPPGHPVVQGEAAAVAELQRGDRGQRLGDGGPMIDGSLGHRPSGRPVGEPVVMPGHDLAVPHHHRGPADDAGGLGEGVESRGHVGPAALGLHPRRGRSGEQDQMQDQMVEGADGGVRHWRRLPAPIWLGADPISGSSTRRRARSHR